MQDIEKVKSLLSDGNKCAIKKGDKLFVSKKPGIAPLMELIDSGEDYSGCEAADKIVGKAAALLYAKIGAKVVYAEVLSKAAVSVLNEYGITFTYSTMADFIHNRQGDGVCPMEKTVEKIDEPNAAFEALKCTIAKLCQGK